MHVVSSSCRRRCCASAHLCSSLSCQSLPRWTRVETNAHVMNYNVLHANALGGGELYLRCGAQKVGACLPALPAAVPLLTASKAGVGLSSDRVSCASKPNQLLPPFFLSLFYVRAAVRVSSSTCGKAGRASTAASPMSLCACIVSTASQKKSPRSFLSSLYQAFHAVLSTSSSWRAGATAAARAAGVRA